MSWKRWLDDYFTLTRKDRIGILLLALLVLLLFLLPGTGLFSRAPAGPEDTSWVAAVKKLEQRQDSQLYRKNQNNDFAYAYQYDRPINRPSPTPEGKLFQFDPNTLSAAGWKDLGLRPRTIQTIQNYLGHGGRFRKPEDLQHIYGLRGDEYERLLPFVNIPATPRLHQPPDKTSAGWTNRKASTYTPVDINTADTSAWIALPGIGSKLAARIVNFREKLGGFYSMDQVTQVYGLADSVFQKIRPYLKSEHISIKKININQSTVDELKSHPYIRYAVAKAIVAYRNEHGHFFQTSDIKKVMLVTDEIYSKLAPYLE